MTINVKCNNGFGSFEQEVYIELLVGACLIWWTKIENSRAVYPLLIDALRNALKTRLNCSSKLCNEFDI